MTKSKDIYTDWTPGQLRRMKRLIDAGLYYAEVGLLMGVTKNAIAGAVMRNPHLKLPREEVRRRMAEANKERAWIAPRPKRAPRSITNAPRAWTERALTERWTDRKKRRGA